MANEGSRDFLRVVLAYFLPPLGVYLQSGIGAPLVINVVLCFLGWFPAQVHAVWMIATVGEGGVEVPDGTRTFVSLLLAALLPPAGVFMKRGVAVGPLLLSCLLTALLWIPGVLHAIWVITSEGPQPSPR